MIVGWFSIFGMLQFHRFLLQKKTFNKSGRIQILYDEMHAPVLTQFYTCDAEGPDVCFSIILSLIHGQYDFRGHPIRGTHKGVSRAYHRG